MANPRQLEGHGDLGRQLRGLLHRLDADLVPRCRQLVDQTELHQAERTGAIRRPRWPES